MSPAKRFPPTLNRYEIYRQHQLSTQVLAASIRGPRDIIAAAKAGADIATVPYKVLQQAAKHPLTDAGLEQFLADWQTFTSRAVEGHTAPSR